MGRKNHGGGRRRPQARRAPEGLKPIKGRGNVNLSTLIMPVGTCPSKKVRFWPESLAAKALGEAQKRRARMGSGREEKRYYACDRCDGFHLTSREEWEQR